jgi:ribosomal-protein-alanine N-acetyltransferase
MRPNDVPAVMDIEQVAFPSPWPESAYYYELRYKRDSHFYVLERQGEEPASQVTQGSGAPHEGERPSVLGYFGLRVKGERAHLRTIAIHPNWRERGLGKFLLLLALERSVQEDAKTMTLEVRSSNTVAQQLYTQMGFKRTGMRENYYRNGEDAWLMSIGPLSEKDIAKLRALRRSVEDKLKKRVFR